MRSVYTPDMLLLLVLILGFAGCSDDPPTFPGTVEPGPCLDKESCSDVPYANQDETGQGFAGSVQCSIRPRRKIDPRLEPGYLGPELAGAADGESPASDSS